MGKSWIRKKIEKKARRVDKKIKVKLHLKHDLSSWGTVSTWTAGDGEKVLSQKRVCMTKGCTYDEQRTRKRPYSR